MPNIDMKVKISDYFDVLQRYECTNRITRSKIRMVRIGFKTDGKYVVRAYVSCMTHNETRHCKTKTEALYQMRQPWVWCDGCDSVVRKLSDALVSAKIEKIEKDLHQTMLDATKENTPANYF